MKPTQPLKSTVLLVDDEAQATSSLRRILRGLPIHIETASNGEEALEWIRGGGQPALVVSDQNMGAGMKGLELLDEVRRLVPQACRVLHTGDERVELVLVLGTAITVLAKPAPPDLVLALVSGLLQGRGGEGQ